VTVPGSAADPGARRERTLLAALLLSLWGPLATGIAVVLSHSTTQLADFVRRTVELVALAVAWAVFRHLRAAGTLTPERRARLERSVSLAVAAALLVSGTVLVLLAAGRVRAFEPGGDVRLGLLIALLGLVVNTWFWRRYGALEREVPNALIGSQRRLYRAKVAVDACVIAALGTVLVAPQQPLAAIVDVGGSLAVAAYLLWSAHRTFMGRAASGTTTPPARSRP
jgi:divalent metal cation (Fe/Co/Zn/Cd) transporter